MSAKAFLFSSFTIGLLLVLVAIELYPNLLFSTLDQSHTIMFICSLIR